ncbi:MAG: anticodon nuclease [Chitinophagaceae bacterium]|nr:MAG: anticodon nuclease [Chitinophagaceae bacterium]
MSETPTASIHQVSDLPKLAIRMRDDLNDHNFVLLYAFNGTGKTRASMEFKDRGKKKNNGDADTLYFNAFTEDLFSWDNDLNEDANRILEFNGESSFFDGFKELEMDTRIRPHLQRYADFDFTINYEERKISFQRSVRMLKFIDGEKREVTEVRDNIKISRGEENLFIWCLFLAVCQLAIDRDDSYKWVKFIYIDDPVSSLDDNNVIAIASHLAQMLIKANGIVKAVVTSHHILFFNVLCNELKNKKHKQYFLHKPANGSYLLRNTHDTPHFHHVAMLGELKAAMECGSIKTYHFNMLRSILEKTASFFGLNDFGKCIHGVDDEILFERALNLLSHGAYSVYEPLEMTEDTKELFTNILTAFLDRYKFHLPEILQPKQA